MEMTGILQIHLETCGNGSQVCGLCIDGNRYCSSPEGMETNFSGLPWDGKIVQDSQRNEHTLCCHTAVATPPVTKKNLSVTSAPCGLRDCKNRPALFPGQML